MTPTSLFLLSFSLLCLIFFIEYEARRRVLNLIELIKGFAEIADVQDQTIRTILRRLEALEERK